MLRILQSKDDKLDKNDMIFSDEVIRVNSREVRKVRILLLTSKRLYILTHESKTDYGIKNYYEMHNIFKIEVAQKNTLLINITFNNL